MSSSKIRKYKKEIINLELEIDEERKNRVGYSLKGDSASIVQSFERVGRLKTQIQEIEDKLYELESHRLKSEIEIGNKKRVKQAEISKFVNNQNISSNSKNRLSNLINNKKDINSIDFKEDYAIILDYLPLGYLNSTMSKFGGKPIAQAIGIDLFTFMELAPKKGVNLDIGEVVYIGKGKRDKIHRVLGKFDVENLTPASRLEIDDAIDEIVEAHEQRYVHYFNTAGSISMKLHGLGLLPGITGPMVRNLLKEREKKKFMSFDDIKNRVPSVKNPQKNVSDKIKEELKLITQKKKHKIRIFTPIPRNTKKKNKRR